MGTVSKRGSVKTIKAIFNFFFAKILLSHFGFKKLEIENVTNQHKFMICSVLNIEYAMLIFAGGYCDSVTGDAPLFIFS